MATINISTEAAALFQRHRQTLELLAATGIQYSDLQNTVREAVFAESHGFRALEADAALGTTEVFESVRDYLRVLMPADVLPGVVQWYHAKVVEAAVTATEISEQHYLGKPRIGDQVDMFPDSNQERGWCERAIAKNKGYKKASSQRDADKATAKAKSQGKQEGGGKKGKKGKGGGTAPAKAASAPTNSLRFSLQDKTPTPNDAPEDARMQKIIDALKDLKIEFTPLAHPPVPTVETMMEHLGSQPGGKCKNLFLKCSKPEAYWLVVALHDATVDVKKLSKMVGAKKPMRFATPEVTASLLGGNKGDLSPFHLANDPERKVNFAVHEGVLAQTEGLWFHPLCNKASFHISAADLLKFVKATGHEVLKFS